MRRTCCREEHRKREDKSGARCPFFLSVSQATLSKTSAKPASKRASTKPISRAGSKARTIVITDSDEDESDETSQPLPEREALKGRGSKSAKSNGSRASTASSVAKSSAAKKSAGKKTSSRAASEDTDGASGSDLGKRASKKKGKAKERIEAIEEEGEDEDEQMYASVHEEEEDEVIVAEPPKRKRGRPPKASTKPPPVKKAKESSVESRLDDGEEQRALAKSTHSRTRSKAVAESESDTQAASSAKPSRHVRQSSVTKKVQRQPSVQEEPRATRSSAEPVMTNGKSAKKKAGKALETSQDEKPPAKPMLAGAQKNGKHHITPSQSQNTDIVSDVDDGEQSIYSAEEVDLPMKRKTSSTPKPKPAPPKDLPKSKGKHRAQSSMSDDAGYATAEPHMDVDVDVRVKHSQERELPTPLDSKPSRKAGGKMRAPSVTKQEVQLNGLGLYADDDIEMKDVMRERPPPPSLSMPLSSIAESPERRAESEQHSSNGLAPHAQNGEASHSGLGINRLGSEAYHQPLKNSVKSSAVHHAGLKGKQKQLQVEVIAPPVPTPQDDDVEMAGDNVDGYDDDVQPLEAPFARRDPFGNLREEPEPPSTPPSHTHHALDDEDEPEQNDTDIPLSPPYSPFLALAPLSKLTSLTEEESAMTVEQWIAREIERQYESFKADAEQKIQDFRARAADARRRIEEL